MDPFYGVGGYVAFAYYPYRHLGLLAGDLHLDLAEPWALESGAGRLDIETVALHEIGHCLGLGHCFLQGSTMWPTYKRTQHGLASEDRNELARVYEGVS